ncbi:hypothetical protein [Kitasatospora sp. KL5]|uniref:hypothetical protein n=1 Tax=Kitasatospora sp. KL5 TaxID=3425125 RepID=UPI003D6E5B19
MATPPDASRTPPPDPASEAAGTPAGPPDPGTPPAPSGPLAQIFAPVEPARTATPIGTTATLSPDTAPNRAGGAKRADGPGGNPQDGPVGALVRALADRLRRTGTTTHIKRQHTVTENRVSGNQATTTNANKTDRAAKNAHSTQHRSSRDAKLADLNNKASQSQDRDNRDVKKADATDAKTSHAKSTKADTSAKTGKDSRDSRDVKTSVAKASKDGTSAKRAADDKNHDARSIRTSDAKGPDGPSGAKAPKPDRPGPPGKAKNRDSKASEPKTGTGKDTSPQKGPHGPGKPVVSAPDAKGLGSKFPDTKPGPGEQAKARAARILPDTLVKRPTAPADGPASPAPVPSTGKDSTAPMATRPTPSASPSMAPASGSTAGLAKTPTPPAQPAPPGTTAAIPAQVNAVGAKAVQFTADGAQHSMSRGEVRTLKQFERRLGAKQTSLARIADGSKNTRATAAEHAKEAQRLAEQARDVEGGERLVGALLRLAEHAQALLGKAEEIEKNAHRGTDAVRALAANAESRHGVIYQAVVDSPLTKPAERTFYQDTQGS